MKEWNVNSYTLVKSLEWVSCLWSRMPMFQSTGIREGGLPLPPTFQYLILVIQRACGLDLIWLQNSKSQKLEWSVYSCFMIWDEKALISKSYYFEASKDIITKFKSQALHIIRMKFWKVGGVATLPSSFLPSGTFYFINKPLPPNIFGPSVLFI